MNGLQRVLAAVGAAVLMHCGDGPVEPGVDENPETSALQEELSANRRRFDEKVGSSYTYEYQNVCFCVVDDTVNVRVTVRDGARVSVVRADDGSSIPTARWGNFLTVTEIFDDIQTAIDEGAASIRAEFDDALGYPRDVYIDVDERIADEERGYTLRNVAIY